MEMPVQDMEVDVAPGEMRKHNEMTTSAQKTEPEDEPVASPSPVKRNDRFDNWSDYATSMNIGGRNEVRSLAEVELNKDGKLEMFWYDAT